jgi:hypothetical protein
MKSSVDWQMRRKRWTAVCNREGKRISKVGRRLAGSRYCLKWYELHVPLWWEGVEDLEEVVEVVERAVWLGRVRTSL